ncbi:MAG: hypothetical protein ACI9QN_001386 [Arcticibacterium sp.]
MNFEQPYFASSDYNEIGREVKTELNSTGGPVPKTNVANNNLGILYKKGSQIRLEKYQGGLDNYAIPSNDLAFQVILGAYLHRLIRFLLILARFRQMFQVS